MDGGGVVMPCRRREGVDGWRGYCVLETTSSFLNASAALGYFCNAFLGVLLSCYHITVQTACNSYFKWKD